MLRASIGTSYVVDKISITYMRMVEISSSKLEAGAIKNRKLS